METENTYQVITDNELLQTEVATEQLEALEAFEEAREIFDTDRFWDAV